MMLYLIKSDACPDISLVGAVCIQISTFEQNANNCIQACFRVILERRTNVTSLSKQIETDTQHAHMKYVCTNSVKYSCF